MTLNNAKKGEVEVTMVDYPKGVIDDFPGVITGRSGTPMAENLFEVCPDESILLLDEQRAQAFRHAVAQLLFAPSRARKDIQTVVAFLTTRVKSPNQDDWGKVNPVIRYIRSTICMPLILRTDGLNIVKWWADTYVATRKDFWGHIGAMMYLG
jgi:hypothetical protein